MPLQQPLSVWVETDQLVIRIGKRVLAVAAERSDFYNPFDPVQNDYVQRYRVVDIHEFAKDVRIELQREEEDGSTMLTDLLDKVFLRVLERGSEAVDDA
jgi:hypothetical protein